MKNQIHYVIIIFLLIGFLPRTMPRCLGQSPSKDSVDQKKLGAVIISASVLYTGTMIGLNSVWYSQYDKQSFRFFNDWPEWNQMDKLGHLYSAFQIASIGSEALKWSGVSKKKSDLFATVTSFAIMSSIEILDGYSSGYGASASDWGANALGAGLFLGQNLLWSEIRIHPKYSFHRSDFAVQRPGTLGQGLMEEIIKDYNGQTIWLSMDIDKFMRFPKWLNIAVGYGTESMIYARQDQNTEQGLYPYRQFYLALDFDLTAIKSRYKAVNTLIYFANMIKLPAPTLEFSQHRVKGHLLYY